MHAGQETRADLWLDPGELALLELFTYGYARGWYARGRLSVIGPDGGTRVERDFDTGATGRVFLPFTADLSGRYRVAVQALNESFRFVLVRHSNYAPPSPEPLVAGPRERVRGFLGGPDDARAVRVDVPAGEALALWVENARAFALADLRRRARERGGGAGSRGKIDSGPGASLHAAFTLSVDGADPVGFAFLPAGPARTLDLRIRTAAPEGDFFDLHVERNPPLVRASGLVVDSEDRPRPGVALTFWREPDEQLLGTVTTDSGGAYAMHLLPGAYRVLLEHGDQRRVVRTTAWHDRELSFALPR